MKSENHGHFWGNCIESEWWIGCCLCVPYFLLVHLILIIILILRKPKIFAVFHSEGRKTEKKVISQLWAESKVHLTAKNFFAAWNFMFVRKEIESMYEFHLFWLWCLKSVLRWWKREKSSQYCVLPFISSKTFRSCGWFCCERSRRGRFRSGARFLPRWKWAFLTGLL